MAQSLLLILHQERRKEKEDIYLKTVHTSMEIFKTAKLKAMAFFNLRLFTMKEILAIAFFMEKGNL
jgi:hypothetical protein